MVRPPLGLETMPHTVKFRLSEDDLRALHAISNGASISVTLRNLIHQERKRLKK